MQLAKAAPAVMTALCRSVPALRFSMKASKAMITEASAETSSHGTRVTTGRLLIFGFLFCGVVDVRDESGIGLVGGRHRRDVHQER